MRDEGSIGGRGRRRAMVLAALLWAAGGAGRADTWRTTDGIVAEGSLSGLFGPLAVISSKEGTRWISVAKLDDASLGQVATFLATANPGPVPWAKSESAVAKALRNRLQVLRDGRLVPFDPADRREPEIYLAYFGALWCGPCVQFSPKLVDAYTRLKAEYGERFELVFVSSDNGASEQLAYVRKAAMPWPVIKFSARGSVRPVERWTARGIPSLVAITPSGDALFHSYVGEEYVGPQRVLKQFEELMRLDPDMPAVKRVRHRLEVVRHVRAAGAESADAKPYLVDFDLRRYQTLDEKRLLATLRINERGQVEEARIEPRLPAVLDQQLVSDAQQWLFLPRVENGRAVSTTAKLPLKLQ